MKYLRRKLESVLKEWALAAPGHPVLIRGARRVGKTSLVEHLGQEAFEGDFVKLDFQTDLERMERIFDAPTDQIDTIITRIGEFKGVRITEKTLVFLDEIQLCEKALNSLRFFVGSSWYVIATGSLLGVTTKQRKLPFPSEVKQLELHPLDFEEFLWALDADAMASDIRAHVETCEPYILHERALEHYRRYLIVGGMPKAVSVFCETNSFDQVHEVQQEIDLTYTADMTDPESGISGISAKRIWESLPKQLLRSSTKKFKYADVVRGGRRERLLEPLEWLEAAGLVTVNDLTCDDEAPLAPYRDDEGSFFKVYIADTGLMFYKFNLSAQAFLDEAIAQDLGSDFRGALAENYVMQSLVANGVKTFYWMRDGLVGNGEIDFVYQNEFAQIIPVEVKSGRNVKAKSLARFMQEGHAPYGIRLSLNDFGKSTVGDTAAPLKCLPLYAAFCIGR